MRRRDLLKALLGVAVTTPLLESGRAALLRRPSLRYTIDNLWVDARARLHAPVSKGKAEGGFLDRDTGDFIPLQEVAPGIWEGTVPAGTRVFEIRGCQEGFTVDFLRIALTGLIG